MALRACCCNSKCDWLHGTTQWNNSTTSVSFKRLHDRRRVSWRTELRNRLTKAWPFTVWTKGVQKVHVRLVKSELFLRCVFEKLRSVFAFGASTWRRDNGSGRSSSQDKLEPCLQQTISRYWAKPVISTQNVAMSSDILPSRCCLKAKEQARRSTH